VSKQVLGIDFSGSADQWSAKRRNSNVWIASGRADGAQLLIDDLSPVQALPGKGAPFDRLVTLLARAEGFAAIDAPFSAPREHAASVSVLWAQVAGLPQEGRPFGRGSDLVAALAPGHGPNGSKSYRACEDVWHRRGLNVPSTLWSGPGGGAALAVAGMTLLHRRGGPVWPLRPGGEGALLVEAYPPAQLMAWGLSPTGYNGVKPATLVARGRIVAALIADHGLVIGDGPARLCRGNADALAAILCAYAAKTIADGRHPRQLPGAARSEGWIVVDETPSVARAGPLTAATTEHRVRSHLDVLLQAMSARDEPAD
jgi:hypothetical protein